MPFSDVHHGRRRFIAIVVALTVNAVALGGMVIRFVDYRHDQQREACQRAMDARQGQRTMWEYLVDQRPADDPEVIAFVAELNKRLPPYVCVDNVPTPAYPPDPD
jgi:hypothetical protein